MADKLVDLIGIGNLLESLVAEDIITCEERDQIIAKIARENGIAEHEYKSPHIASYGMSKREVLEGFDLLFRSMHSKILKMRNDYFYVRPIFEHGFLTNSRDKRPQRLVKSCFSMFCEGAPHCKAEH